MDIEARNALLVEMTGEVAALCTRNNYLQSLAISLAERSAAKDLPDQMAMMQALEREGALDRAVEFLPDDATLGERLGSGRGLSRPELAVLLAYAKNTAYAELLASTVPDDPYLATELFRYFPETLKARHPATIENHRLRREVIATVLSNAMINRGGPAYVEALSAATGAGPAEIAHAYAAARDSFDIAGLNAMIDGLDAQVDGDGAAHALRGSPGAAGVPDAVVPAETSIFRAGSAPSSPAIAMASPRCGPCSGMSCRPISPRRWPTRRSVSSRAARRVIFRAVSPNCRC